MRTLKSVFVLGCAIVLVLLVSLHGQERTGQREGGQREEGGQQPNRASAVCYGLLAGAFVPPNTPPCRIITKIRGDLYVVQSNRHNTVFLVTPAGVILADPISVETATWLKEQINERFHVPVRYVLYSHSHYDHASGAAVFRDTAELWGHANMPGAIRHDTEENAAQVKDVVPPDKTYTDRHTITLGGKTVIMMHPGLNHSDDATVLLFPAERVIHVVDFITTRRPFASELYPPLCKYCNTTFTDWINSFKAVEALDFDLIAPGHGMIGTKADVTLYRRYFEDLVAGVTAGFKAGKTVEQLQASDMLDNKYAWLLGYNPGRHQKIAEAYAYLQATQGAKGAQAAK